MNDNSYQDQVIFAVLMSMISGWIVGGTFLFAAWIELEYYPVGAAPEIQMSIWFTTSISLYITAVMKFI